ncbi:Crp/Fnr family transcriptional regulator [Neobacillus drentensis]|jgi:CRP-like cAMP-binding protein|uniref:Crp/Fnr family transcriptional regulator n=1 Tax=Neobacillus drentensis TaxID=220684 RepID=UPI002FFF72B7
MRNEDILKRLSEVPLFKELSEAEMEPIIRIAQLRFYKHKMYAFMQGDPLNQIYFIHSGRIKIFKTDFSGREQIISIFEPGDLFPLSGFFRRETFPASAEVFEDSQLIVIPLDKFEEILLSNPEICIKLFKVLGEKIMDLQSRLESKVLHNTYEQIIMLLVRLCKSNGEKANGKYRLTIHFTNRELANMIGTTRETISRTISQFKRKNYIAQDEGGFYLIDREALQQELF